MNYDEMPAGHELDNLIAKAVMGWKECHDDDRGSPPGMFETSRASARYRFTSPENAERSDVDFRPSTEISCAWEVTSIMLARKRPLILWQIDDGSWCAATTDGEPSHDDFWIDDHIDHYATASTAPLAICRAALKAMEMK